MRSDTLDYTENATHTYHLSSCLPLYNFANVYYLVYGFYDMFGMCSSLFISVVKITLTRDVMKPSVTSRSRQ